MFIAVSRSFNPDPVLTQIGQELWDLDDNRLKPGHDYAIDLQARAACTLPPLYYIAGAIVLIPT